MAKQSKARARLLAEMATGVGASECHHLFSLPPFGCRRALWYSKTGARPDFPVTETKDMQRGTALEAIIRKLYAQRVGANVRKSPMLRHPAQAGLICHPDGIIESIFKDGTSRDGPGLLEIKCPGTRNYLWIKQHGLGDSWLLQAQQGMLVSGCRWCHFVVFNADEWDFTLTNLDRDEAVQGSILESAGEFVSQFAGHEPEPPRLPPDDARCHKCPWRTKCQGQHLMMQVAAEESRSELTTLPRRDELAPMVQEYAEAAALEREAGNLKDRAAKALKDGLGNLAGAITDAGRVYYRPTERTTIDTKALRAERPEVANQYARTSVVRTLKVYGA